MAALDFPASPSIGQKYPEPAIAGAGQYQWNGTVWLSVGTVSDVVRKSGDTMSGNLNIQKANPAFALVKLVATETCALWGYLLGTARWGIRMPNAAPESSANAGSDFQIDRYADNGNYLGTPLTITRSTGRVTTEAELIAGGQVNSQSGRIISYAAAAGAQPSIVMYAGNRSTAPGFWNNTSNVIAWGSCDSGGAPSSQAGFLSPNGTINCIGPVQAYGGRIISYAANAAPTISMWYGAVGAARGMSINSNGDFILGIHGADGAYSSTLGWFNPSGGFTAMAGLYSNNSQGVRILNSDHLGGGYYMSTMAISSNVAGYGMSIQANHDTAAARAYIRFDLGNIYDFDTGGNAWKAGGGAWASNSDARVKTVHGDYQAGLSEVLQLAPVIYSYKGNDKAPEAEAQEEKSDEHKAMAARIAKEAAEKQWIGLIAQAAEVPMPELVKSGPGWIDGQQVEDFRTIDTSPLVFALVNCIKELHARIEALEATR